jgi:hypothetical protein
MSSKPFDRTTIGVREKPLSTDPNNEASQRDRTLRDVLMRVLSPAAASSSAGNPSTGFLSDGFRPVASSPAGMSVVIQPGIGFIFDGSNPASGIGLPDIEGLDDLSSYVPVVLDGAVTFTVPAAPSSPNSRIDLIEVRSNRLQTDITSRLQFNEVTRQFAPKDYFKTLSYLVDGSTGIVTGGGPSTAALSYKVGTPGNPGVQPLLTPGYQIVGLVNVGNATTSITGLNLVDSRPLAAPGGVMRGSARFRLQWNSGAPTATLLDSTLPPSVNMVMSPLTGARATALVYLVGGAILSGTVQAQFETPPSFSGNIYFVGRIRMGSTFHQALISADQTKIFTGVPAVAVGVGTSVLQTTVEALHVDGGTGAADQTNVGLEDVVWSVSFQFRYA